MHFLLRGTDWLELDPSGTTLNFRSSTGTKFSFNGDLEVTGNISGPGSISFKSYGASFPGVPDVHYFAGFYFAPAAEAALTNAAPTQTLGTAQTAYGAHAFWVSAGDGATDGSDLVITVTGASITDLGVLNGSDSEVIVADAVAASSAVNTYYETTKKWVGQVTYTLSSTEGFAYNASGNYGFAKYEDFGNRDFTVADFECTWEGLVTAADNNISLLLHSDVGWTHSAAAFDPGGTVITDLDTDYGANDTVTAAQPGAYKRAGLTQAVDGDALEGVVIKVDAPTDSTFDAINCHIGVTFD